MPRTLANNRANNRVAQSQQPVKLAPKPPEKLGQVTLDVPVEKERPKFDPRILRRTLGVRPAPPPEPPPVSAGPVDKVIELAFNPTREKIREVTIVDRMQGRLLPLLDLTALVWQYVIEVAMYRQDSNKYEREYKKPKPVQSNLIDEYMYRLAQWQKSVAGKNLERATDIALAETETRGENEEDVSGRDAWKE